MKFVGKMHRFRLPLRSELFHHSSYRDGGNGLN